MATASGRVNTPTTSTSASANGKNFSSLASPSLSRTSSCITTCTTSAPSSSSSSSSPPANYIHYCHKIDLTSAKVKGHNCYFCTLFVYLTIILTIQTTTALANTSTSSNSNSNSNNNNSNHASSDGGGVKGLSLPKSVVANSLVPIIIEKEKDEVSSVDVKERTSSITDAAGERRGEESPSLSFLPSVGGGKLLWPSGTLKEKADEGSQLNSGHSNCLSSEQGSHLQAKLQQQQGQRQELRLNSPTIHDDRHQHSHPHHLSTASHPLDSTPITRMDPASASSSNQSEFVFSTRVFIRTVLIEHFAVGFFRLNCVFNFFLQIQFNPLRLLNSWWDVIARVNLFVYCISSPDSLSLSRALSFSLFPCCCKFSLLPCYRLHRWSVL